ncbi:Hemicentin-1 [Mactra antiquata]
MDVFMVVDGGWGAWSEWSACKETCGNTIRTRSRNCDDPIPAGGGLDCIGDKQQYDNCTLSPCPIHGGWSTWDSWSSCSKTCGIGLQRRDRHCSSPYPDYGGNHCFGDALENRVCMDKACSDGGWTLWSVWSSCSHTCGHGLKSRTRSCSNPVPSSLGKPCTGNNVEYSMCTQNKCPDTTSSDKVYFSVNTSTGTLYNQHSPIFSNVVINTGGGYNVSTGKFTAPKAGVYQFSSTFVTDRSTTQCFIRKNGAILVYALTTAVNDYKSASASVYVHLETGDVVDQSCGGWQYVDLNKTSMFSGALVSAD